LGPTGKRLRGDSQKDLRAPVATAGTLLKTKLGHYLDFTYWANVCKIANATVPATSFTRQIAWHSLVLHLPTRRRRRAASACRRWAAPRTTCMVVMPDADIDQATDAPMGAA
jgi:hypothetical protein